MKRIFLAALCFNISAWPVTPLAARTTVFFGTTVSGGSNNMGTIFKFTPSTGTEQVVWNFSGGTDGANPEGDLVYDTGSGLFYGMTTNGGSYNYGVIFSFNPITNAENVLWTFGSDTDGKNPARGTLIYDANNGLYYGMTEQGGSSTTKCGSIGCGTIFTFNPATNAENVLWSFGNGSDGFRPEGSFVYDSANGLFYSMTWFGGTNSYGTIISFNPTTNAENVVWNFGSTGDGGGPYGDLVYYADSGLFYGMTLGGGGFSDGVIFSFNPATNAENVLWAFGRTQDGRSPYGSLVYYPGNGLFYGMTSEGGNNTGLSCYNGCGAIISYNPSTNTENFPASLGNGNAAGIFPGGDLVYDSVNALFYGLTNEGGTNGKGVIFSYNPTIDALNYLWSFGNGTDGAGPDNSLVSYSELCNGTLVASLTGPSAVCTGSSITLADDSSGGVWSSRNTGIATVDTSGKVTGMAAGTDTITYTVTNICGSQSVLKTITINAPYTVDTVPNQTVCGGASTTAINFSGNTPGTVYNWTSSNTTIGLSASGAGNIPQFTATNTGAVPVVDTITVMPAIIGNAYIGNYYDGTVSVINTATNTVTTTIHGFNGPFALAVTPDRSKVYVTNSGVGNVLVISTATNIISATITEPGGYFPENVAISPDGSKAYVTNTLANAVSVINIANDSIIANIYVGTNPIGIAVSPDGSKVYVSNENSDNISVISTAADTVSNTINLPYVLSGLAITPDGSKLYVATNNIFTGLEIVSTLTNSIMGNITVGNNAFGVAVSPDGSKVYATNYSSNNVSVISTATDSVIATVPVGTEPEGVCVASDGKQVYVANAGSKNVSVISTATNTVTYTITVGNQPESMGNFISSSGNGCPGAPITFTITVNPEATASITANGPTTFCSGDSVTLTANTGAAYLWSTGATTQSIAVKQTGNYTVQVTSAICSGSATSSPTTVTVNTSASASITPGGPTTFCSGDSVILTANSGVSYLWSNSATSQSITVKQSGNYSVQVTSSNCGSATSTSVAVTVNLLPTASITPNGATTFCSGDSVTLTASTASTYLWNNSATTQSINVKTAGNYIVVVSNANNCSATSTATTVAVNALPTATITPNGATTFCQGDSVTLTANTESSYLWSNSATTQSINVKTGGNYTVIVSNASNCSATSTATTVAVNSLPTATITPNGTTTFCEGDSVSLTASTGTAYLWSNSSTTQSINVKTAGHYTVVVSNANNCSATSTAATVTVNSLPTAIITSNGATTFCQGDSVILTANTESSYLWSNSATTQSINVKTGGNYTVIVSNANNCSATSTATIVTVNSLPTATITANGATTFCQGDSVILTASTGTAYLWSNSATTQSVNVKMSGSYTVLVTNANNCSATSTATTVIVNALPTATITPDGATTFCEGDSVTLTASAGTSYLWSTNATAQSIVIKQSGNYSVVVSNANNCSATSSATSVTVNSLPASTITPLGATTFCEGDSVTLSTNTNTTYLWSNNATTQSITVNQSGDYTVVVTNANNCSASSVPTTVTVNALPDATINGPTDICSGLYDTLTASGGVAYLWGNSLGNSAQITVAPTTTTTYVVTVTDNNNCSATASQTVSVTSSPTASISGPSQICTGDTAILTANGGNSYAWSNSLGSNPTITVSPANTATYTVTASIGAGCSATASQTVTVNSLPAPGISPATDSICFGASTTLIASGGINYLWNNSVNGDSNTVSPNNTTSYTVTVTDINNCSASISRTVTVNLLPSPEILPATDTICSGSTATLIASGGVSYAWSNSVNTDTNTVSPNNTIIYSVTVTDNNLCSASAGITVVVNPLPLPVISPETDTICSGGVTTLVASGGISYAWNNNVNTDTNAVSPDSTGTYTVTVTDIHSCSASTNVTIMVNLLPNATISGLADICTGLSDTLTASGGVNYNWSDSLGTNPQVAVTPTGITTYTVTVTNTNNCSATASQTVNVTTNPTATITGPSQICSGDSLTLTANGGSTYAWANGLGSNAAITVTPTSTTTYSVTASIGISCSASATQTVTVNEAAAYQFAQSICNGQSYSFKNQTLTQSGAYYDTLQTIHGCDSLVTLNLTVNNTFQTEINDSICNGHSITFHNHNIAQSGVYRDTLQAETGCDSVVTLNLTVDSLPTPSVTRINDTLQTQNFISYQWLLSGTPLSPDTTRNIVITQNGNYSVAVTNANGCSDTSAALNVTGLSIEGVITDYGVKLYPNPNAGIFTLEFTDNAIREIEITDAVGRTIVAATKVERQKNFNLNDIASGVYILRITQNNEVKTLKFSVMR